MLLSATVAAALGWTVPLQQAVIGLLAGYFSLWAINELFRRTMGEMDDITQQNAAMTEEATAAARQLANEAVSLNQQVARFRLDRGATGAPHLRAVG